MAASSDSYDRAPPARARLEVSGVLYVCVLFHWDGSTPRHRASHAYGTIQIDFCTPDLMATMQSWYGGVRDEDGTKCNRVGSS